MSEFHTADFNISKINICVYVKAGTGQNIHKNRPYHGLVIELTGIKKYVFKNGKSMVVQPNDVFYLPKFSDYEVISLRDGDCIAVNFELTDENVTYTCFKLKQESNKYKKDFERLLENWDSGKNGHMNLCYMCLYKIISNIQYDLSQQYIPSKTKQLVIIADEYIAQNIGDYTLTIDKVANVIGISPEYFRKIFRGVYGCSPKKYIIDMRMEKAKSLLSLNEFSIAEISQMCGYDCESYFSSEFKRIVGCPPTKYNQSEVLPRES